MAKSIDTLDRVDGLFYLDLAGKASKSPEISGDYGRKSILSELLKAYMILSPNDPYLNDLRGAINFVTGDTTYTSEIKDIALRGTIDRQIIVPLFEEKKNKGQVFSNYLEKLMATWLRDRDSELRDNRKKYTAMLNNLSPAEHAGLTAALLQNQLRYTAAIVRRMSKMLKIKYPELSTDMDVVYAQVSKGTDESQELAEAVLTKLGEQSSQEFLQKFPAPALTPAQESEQAFLREFPAPASDLSFGLVPSLASVTESKVDNGAEFLRLADTLANMSTLDPGEQKMFYDLGQEYRTKGIEPQRMNELLSMFRNVIAQRAPPKSSFYAGPFGSQATVGLDIDRLK